MSTTPLTEVSYWFQATRNSRRKTVLSMILRNILQKPSDIFVEGTCQAWSLFGPGNYFPPRNEAGCTPTLTRLRSFQASKRGPDGQLCFCFFHRDRGLRHVHDFSFLSLPDGLPRRDAHKEHLALLFYKVDHTVRRRANQVRGRAATVFP